MIILALALLFVLVPSAALALGGPTLSVSPSSGPVPATITITGHGWSNSSLIDIYMDPQTIPDPHHLVCQSKPTLGVFKESIQLPAMSVSDHKIVAAQGPTQIEAIFTVKRTQPLDDRIKDEIKDIFNAVCQVNNNLLNVQSIVTNIQTIVTDIQTKLNDSNSGLVEIKNEVADIQTKVNDSGYGLEEIKDEVTDIQNNVDSASFGLETIKDGVDDVQESLADVTTMKVYGDNYEGSYPHAAYQTIVDKEYTNPRHIAVTIYYNALDDSSKGITIEALIGEGAGAHWFDLEELIGGADPPEGSVSLDFVAVGWGIRFKNNADTFLYIHYDVAAEGIAEP